MLPDVCMRARTHAMSRSDRLTRDRDHHDKKYHRHAPGLTCGACSQAWPFSSGRLTTRIGILPCDQPFPHDMIIVADLAASSCSRFSHPADSHDLSRRFGGGASQVLSILRQNHHTVFSNGFRSEDAKCNDQPEASPHTKASLPGRRRARTGRDGRHRHLGRPTRVYPGCPRPCGRSRLGTVMRSSWWTGDLLMPACGDDGMPGLATRATGRRHAGRAGLMCRRR